MLHEVAGYTQPSCPQSRDRCGNRRCRDTTFAYKAGHRKRKRELGASKALGSRESRPRTGKLPSRDPSREFGYSPPMRAEYLALASTARGIAPGDQVGSGSSLARALRSSDMLALACGGLPDPSRSAFMLRVTGERDYIGAVREALQREAQQLADAEDWPDTFPRTREPYLESLVELAIAEELHPGKLRTNVARAAALGVCYSNYRAVHRRRYEALRYAVDGWAEHAARHIQARLNRR